MVQLWDIAGLVPVATLTDQATTVAFGPGGALAVASDSSTRIWNTSIKQRTATPTSTVPASVVERSAGGMAFSPDGATLVIGNGDTLRQWNVATGKELRSLAGLGSGNLAVSSDGSAVAVSGDDVIQIWDIAAQKKVTTLTHTGRITRMAFGADGTNLAVGVDGGHSPFSDAIQLWDIASGKNVATLHRPLESLAWEFTLNGTTVAVSTGFGKTVELWDTRAGDQTNTLTHTGEGQGPVVALAFSPDGTTLAASTGASNTVELWDVATHARIAALNVADYVHALTFSRDGSTLATVSGKPDSEYGTVSLWDVTKLRDPYAAACSRAARPLTAQEWSEHTGGLPFQQVCGPS
jgi:WD40 repeat protein